MRGKGQVATDSLDSSLWQGCGACVEVGHDRGIGRPIRTTARPSWEDAGWGSGSGAGQKQILSEAVLEARAPDPGDKVSFDIKGEGSSQVSSLDNWVRSWAPLPEMG